jgi:hypothetical protein
MVTSPDESATTKSGTASKTDPPYNGPLSPF